MQLIIKNIGKIEQADILIDGITVIAGENNSGKSTVGKVLNATINSLYGFDEYVAEMRKNIVKDEFKDFGKQLDMFCKEYIDKMRKRTKAVELLQDKHANQVMEAFSDQDIYKIVNNYAKEHIELYITGSLLNSIDSRAIDTVVADAYTNIINILQIDDDEVGCLKITNAFNGILDNQVVSLFENNDIGEVILRIKEKESILKFQKSRTKDICSKVERNSYINNLAMFIEDPRRLDVLDFSLELLKDDVNSENYGILLEAILSPGGSKRSIAETLKNDFETTDARTLQAILNKNKLNDVMEKIYKILNGKFIFENKKLVFQDNEIDGSISLQNLSTGLKSFALIERALDSGLIKEKSIVILDEPEINLHPDWQEKYAEIIVILQRELDLNIVLTTHSPYFLKAIQYYTKKYERQEVCHYYLAENLNGKGQIYQVDDCIQSVYKRLAEPMVRMTGL